MYYVSYDYYMSWYNYFYSIPTTVRSEGETKETEIKCTEGTEGTEAQDIKEAMRAAINDPDPPELLEGSETEAVIPEFQSSVWSQPRYLRQNVRKKNKKKK